MASAGALRGRASSLTWREAPRRKGALGARRYGLRSMDTNLIEAAVRGHCAQRRDVVAVYLHGSRARGTARASSDVDIAVLYEEPPPPGLEALSLPLEAELEQDLGIPVQLLTLNTAPPDVVHRVLRDAVLLFERDASTRVAFEVRARNEYFDVQPYLDEYRRAAS